MIFFGKCLCVPSCQYVSPIFNLRPLLDEMIYTPFLMNANPDNCTVLKCEEKLLPVVEPSCGKVWNTEVI